MSGRHLFDALEREGWSLLERWVVEGERESLHLEAKCAQMDEGPGKLGVKTAADIAKAISGLANAEGGVVLVGVDAQKPPDGGDDRIVRIVPVRGLASFARFVGERASQLVQPEVPGLRLLQLPDPADGDQGVVAIYVPPTDVGPFRTGRNLSAGKAGSKDVSERYYFRNGSNTDVMSHALLGLMFGQRPAPAVRLITETQTVNVPQAQPYAYIRVLAENYGRGSARALSVFLEHCDPWTLPHGMRASVWLGVATRVAMDGPSGVTYQAAVSTVLHPQQVLLVCDSNGVPGRFPRTFRMRGAIYAEGMIPVRFDEEIELKPGQNVRTIVGGA